jgi:hypothetical protein
MLSRLAKATLLMIFLVAVSSNMATATPLQACISPRQNEIFRSVNASTTPTMWLARHGDRFDLCIGLENCEWSLVDLPINGLGAFSDLADGETGRCSNSLIDGRYWQGGIDYSKCTMPKELLERLSLLERRLRAIGGNTSCGSQRSPPNGAGLLLKTGVGQVLTLQARAGTICLALGTSLETAGGTFVIVSPTCPSSDDDAKQRYLQFVTQTLQQKSGVSWIGAGTVTDGFVLAANNDGIGRADDTDPIVWGSSIDKAYVANWLKKIAIAAAASDAIAKKGDPLPGASETDFGGRAARWLVAGFSRVGSRPFTPEWRQSGPARDWMTSNVLSGLSAFEGTLLRGELARTDWQP